MRNNIKRNTWIAIILVVALLSRFLFEYIIGLLNVNVQYSQFLYEFLRWSINILAIIIWIRIVVKSEYSVSKLPWLLILIIEPFAGLFLFLTFGRDYRKSFRHIRHSKVHDGKYLFNEPVTPFDSEIYLAIDSEITDIYKTAYNMTKHHAYLNNSSATVLTDGEEFFPKLKEELMKAEKFILMQFYIIRTDSLGKDVLDILKYKASKGVDVYLLYDAVGSIFLNSKYMKSLLNAGVKVDVIDPIVFGFFDTRVNYRNHRKQVVIDGNVGFIGGMNLGNEYYKKQKRIPMFRDTQLMISGKAVNSITALFFRDWYYTTDKLVKDDKYYCAKDIVCKGLVQIVPSGPDYKYPPIRNIYVKMINNAKKCIKIMTPYLALDHETVTSLIIAARGGVKVELIVPGVPDKKLIYEVTQSYFEELLSEGIKIYKYKHKFTHAKVFIVDNNIASCGTYNLDNRSARINFEVTCLLYQTGVDKLVEDFRLDRSKSKEVDINKWSKRNFVKRLFEGLISIASPLV